MSFGYIYYKDYDDILEHGSERYIEDIRRIAQKLNNDGYVESGYSVLKVIDKLYAINEKVNEFNLYVGVISKILEAVEKYGSCNYSSETYHDILKKYGSDVMDRYYCTLGCKTKVIKRE